MGKKGSSYEKFVANVVAAIDENVKVEYSQWVQGPDGRRDMDVSVTGILNGKTCSMMIECKDYDVHKTGAVGIELVDALDSKRRDLNLDLAMICSNSGFTEGALTKAKRLNLGLISILKTGDEHVKIEIEEVFYKRQITFSNIDISFDFVDPSPIINIDDTKAIKFEGLSISNWVDKRAFMIAQKYPSMTTPITASHKFKSPTIIVFGETAHEVSCFSFNFNFVTQWYRATHRIDASLGIYDFIRKKLHIGGTEQGQYVIKDVNAYDLGFPVDYVPDQKELDIEPTSQEINVRIGFTNITIANENEIPRLDEHIIPEDLKMDL